MHLSSVFELNMCGFCCFLKKKKESALVIMTHSALRVLCSWTRSRVAAEVRQVTAPGLAAGPGTPHYLPSSLARRTGGSGPLTVFGRPGSPLRHAPLSAGSDSEAAHHSLRLRLVHQADGPTHAPVCLFPRFSGYLMMCVSAKPKAQQT